MKLKLELELKVICLLRTDVLYLEKEKINFFLSSNEKLHFPSKIKKVFSFCKYLLVFVSIKIAFSYGKKYVHKVIHPQTVEYPTILFCSSRTLKFFLWYSYTILSVNIEQVICYVNRFVLLFRRLVSPFKCCLCFSLFYCCIFYKYGYNIHTWQLLNFVVKNKMSVKNNPLFLFGYPSTVF